MNKIFVIGRLTADPTASEVSGRSCANFRIASDTKRKDDAGNYIPVFYQVSVWGKPGESCVKFLHKGDKVSVVGDFSCREYTDTKGQSRYSLQIDASGDVEFLSTRGEANAAPAAPNRNTNTQYTNQRKPQPQGGNSFVAQSEDLPF